MTDNEKQIMKDLLNIIEFLNYKVKVHNDVLERVLIQKPNLIPSTLMANIEEGNRKIAQLDLAEIKTKIQNL